jgi:hypothetical protein
MSDATRSVTVKVNVVNGEMKLGPIDSSSILAEIEKVRKAAESIKVQPFSGSAVTQLQQIGGDIGSSRGGQWPGRRGCGCCSTGGRRGAAQSGRRGVSEAVGRGQSDDQSAEGGGWA